MRGIYTPDLHCESCIDTAELFGDISPERCEHCKKVNQEEVGIMSLGDEIFGEKMTIVYDDGEVEVVNASDVVIIMK